MAGQTLTTTILINAKTGNGFNAVGATLTELGTLVSNISDPLIEFGKDSLRVYRDYEDSMKDAEVALSTTYGRGTRELNNVMKELDSAASEWAANSIFHTNDVANAIAETSHAGWNLNQIMSGIPAAMELAQAGGIDLSTAVDYIVKSANAAKIPFEDIGEFIDHWAFAANSSSTDIDEMGQALIRLGGTSQFAENTDELLSMLAVLGDVGSVGSEAGTLLRNTMIRLVAPTDKAREVMDGLGVEAGELDAALSDESLVAASEMLEQVGFSAYDQEGNLKSFSQTFLDLNDALGRIEREDDANAILSAIFPTRTITGAKALLDGVTEKWETLYDTMQSGEAEGYGQYASETRMESLSGSLELFESKVEELKRTVGEDLAPDVMGIAEALGELVDSVSGMDDAAFAGLVGGLEVIAGSGFGLIAAGTAFRLVGSALSALGTPAGAVILTAIAVTALTSALSAYEEHRFEDLFGENTLNAGEITAKINEIADAFDARHSSYTEFANAFETAFKSYSDLSTALSSDALTDAITKKELSGEDIKKYFQIGEQLGQELKNGINSGLSANLAALNSLWGTENPEDISDPMWAQINGILTQGYSGLIDQANDLSQQLRDAMTSAFEDGSLTGDEVANMMAVIQRQEELLAMQSDVAFAGERAEILRKARTLGLDSIQESVAEMKAEREREASANANMYGQLIEMAKWSIEKYGGYTDENGQFQAVNEEQGKAYIAELEKRAADQQASDDLATNAMIMDVMTAGIQGSDLGDAFNALTSAADSLQESGGVVTSEIGDILGPYMSQMGDVERYAGLMVDALGGVEQAETIRDYLAEHGDATSASAYQDLIDAFNLSRLANAGNLQAGQVTRERTEADGSLIGQLSTIFGEAGFDMSYIADALGSAAETQESAGMALYNAVGGNTALADTLSGTMGVSGWESIANMVSAALAESTATWAGSLSTMSFPAQDTVGLGTAVQQAPSLTDMGAETVQVDGDTTELKAKIQAEDGGRLTQYIDGDASQLHTTIYAEDGQYLTEFVTGDVTELDRAINRYQGHVVTVHIQAVGGGSLINSFAEGGRATQASIFGEAGPEWAIPEEHTSRTAALLNEARQASGFSWEELLSRYGGFNSDVNHVPATVIYSPTINANDATGVENVLADDKNRLMKWFKEMQAREEMEVFA